MGTLKVLLWKHLVVRMRRFIHTPIEIFSPVVFFIILFSFKKFLTDIKLPEELDEFRIQQTESILLNDVPGPQSVFYTPDTDQTRLLMEKVGEKLKLPKQYFTGSLRNKGFTPIESEADLLLYFKDNNERVAVIIFENMNGSWPEKLTYTIRMNTDFVTNLYEALDDTKQPHERFGTIYEPFMKLQWAIDSSYMELLTGNKIKQRVTLQEFPYVRSPEVNPSIKFVSVILYIVCWMSLLLVFVFLMSRLLEERVTGIQELIKMVGVSNTALSMSHFVNVLPAGLMYSLLGTTLLKVTSAPIIPHTSPIYIFVTLALHYSSVVSMAFACSYLAKSTQYAVTLATFAYIFLYIPSRVITVNQDTKLIYKVLAGMLPHNPMDWFWNELSNVELYGRGLTFNDAVSGVGIYLPTMTCYLLMVLQITLFSLLSWYLSHVRPGPYGQADPWNFLCMKEYWIKTPATKVSPDEEAEELEGANQSDPIFFEPPPKHMEVGIKIVNVSKVFPKHRALNNVSLDVYKGEITVLLGHNGAGKTTLMSIITGMLSATEGKVYVEGLDTVQQKQEMRKLLGLCPQHNLFFPDLTVLEHIMFFTLLKGSSYSDAKISSLALLEKLGLADKVNSKSSQLSGGMKRRLQLGCALAGDARVLVLDEPTSGLDVETRRELWDLLLSLRESRTVLLSTHFMEEADALGDRVAALHAGRLRCHATPMHLKRALGTGYRLTFTTIGIPNEPAITSLITSHVPEATVKEQSLNSISYNLPSKSARMFPKLFNALESKRSSLGIDSIGVGVSTLEEVFLKLCSDVTTTFTEDTVDGSTEPVYPKLSGMALYSRQMLVLMKRQFQYIWSKKLPFLIMVVLLPIGMMFAFTSICNVPSEPERQFDKKIAMNPRLYRALTPRVLYSVNATGADVVPLRDQYATVHFEKAPDVTDAVLRSGKKDVLEYSEYIAGIEINETDAKVLFTTVVRHAAPVALNLLSNALASTLPGADGATITTYNQPLIDKNIVLRTMNTAKMPKDNMNISMWIIFICFISLATLINAASLPCKERETGTRHIHVMTGCPPALHWAATLVSHSLIYCTVLVSFFLLFPSFDSDVSLATLINAASLPCKERETGTRHIHVMTGCPPALHWAATLVSHALIYCAVLIVGAVAAALIVEKDQTIDQPDFLAVLSLVLFLGVLAALSMVYLVSFWFGERGTGVFLVALIIVSGMFAPAVKTASELVKETGPSSFLDLVLLVSSFTLPPHTLAATGLKCANVARQTAMCRLTKQCADLALTGDENAIVGPKTYFGFTQASPLVGIITLLVQFIVLMTLVVWTEKGFFNRVFDRIFNASYRPAAPVDTDDMIRAEKAYVEKAITLPKKQIPDAMLVSDVHKKYWRFFGKPCNAVQGISFSVKKGECFGLLGVNGAGKSSTFKILSGIECATRGTVFAAGHFLHQAPTQYLQSLGYCPQFFGLDGFLTGNDNLTLLLTLRGLAAEDVRKEVASWIGIVGLEKYARRAVSGYSGGCARRLATAGALCTGGAVTLLDEPTAGVDVAARRRVWAAVRRAASSRALVITSHSMDEMEALCQRIAIMSSGRVRALGEAAALRAAHAAGHAVQLKLAPRSEDETDSAASQVERLKAALHKKFDCTLRDEHRTMLHYHINETMRYSELFTALETLRKEFPDLLEDYSVTETTLEEVFLSFAKAENPDDANPTPV